MDASKLQEILHQQQEQIQAQMAQMAEMQQQQARLGQAIEQLLAREPSAPQAHDQDAPAPRRPAKLGTVKLQLPEFDGSGDVKRWARKITMALDCMDTDDIQAANVIYLNCLKGPALTFVDSHPTALEGGWEHLMGILLNRFEVPLLQVDYRHQLRELMLKDGGNVEHFYNKFTGVVARIEPVMSDTEQYYAWYFSMPAWLRDRILSQADGTLDGAVNVTRQALQGAKMAKTLSAPSPQQQGPVPMELNTFKHHQGGHQNPRRQGKWQQKRPSGSHDPPAPSHQSKKASALSTEEERQRRLAKGLCFKCGEKGHMLRDCPGAKKKGMGNGSA